MKRHEYEMSLLTPGESQASRYMRATSRLDALLADLGVRINLYEDGSLYRYRILDSEDKKVIDGLDPAYANAGDYRQIILSLREKHEG